MAFPCIPNTKCVPRLWRSFMSTVPFPGLTAGPIHWRSFGPAFIFFTGGPSDLIYLLIDSFPDSRENFWERYFPRSLTGRMKK
jgi:hypothetical protein